MESLEKPKTEAECYNTIVAPVSENHYIGKDSVKDYYNKLTTSNHWFVGLATESARSGW